MSSTTDQQARPLPGLGYLDRAEVPYRRSTSVPGVPWLLGQPWLQCWQAEHGRGLATEPQRPDAGPRVHWDHKHALLPGGGRRVLLNQPYGPLSEHLADAREFAAFHGLDAHPVAESLEDLPTSAVLFVRSGVGVADVVAALRGQWMALFPGATAPREGGR